jgi:phospholipid/cholesterol/gamma-HCH transport system substrate-binding protein
VLILADARPRHYKLLFANAGQLVKGDRVRIGGTPAGSITGIDLSKDGQAEVSIKLDHQFGPLREGTTAIVRQIGLTSVAGRYVDISPAPTFRPALDDGATISAKDTTSIVDLDQLFNALNPATRKGLQQLIDGSASWYEGKEENANASAKAFPGTLSTLDQLATELSSDDANLSRFLIKAGDAFSALSDHKEELTDLVTHTRETTAALGENTESLDQALQHVAPALQKGTSAFVALRSRSCAGSSTSRALRPRTSRRSRASCAPCSSRACRPSSACARCSRSPAPTTTCSTRSRTCPSSTA